MSVELQTRIVWPVENTLSVASTAEIMGAGAPEDTFPLTAKFLEIGYVDKDCFIGPTEASLATAADGSQGGRIFIKAESGGRVIPWNSREVWFINATGSETPTLYINGLF